MGIAAKALQLDEVLSGDISSGSVGELLKQRNGLGHHQSILAVQKRQQPKLTFGLLRLTLNPAPSQVPIPDG